MRAYKSGRKELFSLFCFLNKQVFHLSLPVNLRAGMLILIAVFGNSHLEPTHKALTGPFRIVKTLCGRTASARMTVFSVSL